MLQVAHEKLRKWLWRRIGRYPYFASWEVTRGSDGRGHPHIHIIAWWPFVDYKDMIAEFKLATYGRGSVYFEEIEGGADDVAKYVAKYATKGFSPDNQGAFPAELAAQVADTFYQRRMYSASRGFWVRDCGCEKCLQPARLVEIQRVRTRLPPLLNVSTLQPRALSPPGRWPLAP